MNLPDATDPGGDTRVLGAGRPELMITDPPYGVDYDPLWRQRAGLGTNLPEPEGPSIGNGSRTECVVASEVLQPHQTRVYRSDLRQMTLKEGK